MSEFSYISEKIAKAQFVEYPYKHLWIEDFLSKEHLSEILSDDQIHFEEQESTKLLVDKLSTSGYKVQNFPGCTTDVKEYLHHYENDSFPSGRKGTPIESYGITYRLIDTNNSKIKSLVDYMNGPDFKKTLEDKFEITNKTRVDTAIQKNLSHYEISPHPDVREKELTYLLNINKDDKAESLPIHTHLLKFKDEWSFVKDYWANNKKKNTTWVPWDWCESCFETRKNNSIVIFKPNVDTLHAVKMIYDHTKFQRTQIYGNLMGLGKIVDPMNYRELQEIRDKNAKIS